MSIGIPKLIRIDRRGRECTVEIDGVEFTYAIAENGIAVDVSRDELPTVTLQLVAERIELTNDVHERPAGDPGQA